MTSTSGAASAAPQTFSDQEIHMPYADVSTPFDFRKRVAYDPERKQLFHARARQQLRKLAAALRLSPRDYDLRSNFGGIAVSGEVTLHADRLYVQVCQPATGSDTGILFRACRGRKDYEGGRNRFASLDLLNDPEALAQRIIGLVSVDETSNGAAP
jgi:hypothetical protein